MKSVRSWSFSGQYFLVLGLNLLWTLNIFPQFLAKFLRLINYINPLWKVSCFFCCCYFDWFFVFSVLQRDYRFFFFLCIQLRTCLKLHQPRSLRMYPFRYKRKTEKRVLRTRLKLQVFQKFSWPLLQYKRI